MDWRKKQLKLASVIKEGVNKLSVSADGFMIESLTPCHDDSTANAWFFNIVARRKGDKEKFQTNGVRIERDLLSYNLSTVFALFYRLIERGYERLTEAE